MATRKYEPAKGPQQRRRLLRDLAVPRGRTLSPNYSYSQVRRVVARMFNFKPLTPINQEKFSLLKKMAMGKTLKQMAGNSDKARGFLHGTDRKGNYSIGREQRRAEKEEVVELFTDAEKAEKTWVNEGGCHKIFLDTRGLESYTAAGIDVLKDAREIRARQGRPIRFLDVGHHTGRVASELKAEMGEEVETHTLSPWEAAKFPGVDNYHLLFAEFFPKEFRRHFDHIVSYRSLEYALFPDICLRNIAESLAPGGRAVVQWYGGRFNWGRDPNLFFGPPAREYAQHFQKAKLTTGGRKVMQAAFDDLGAFKTLDEVMSEGGFFKKHAIVWCNEVARLKEDKNLQVRVERYHSEQSGFTPELLVIERKR